MKFQLNFAFAALAALICSGMAAAADWPHLDLVAMDQAGALPAPVPVTVTKDSVYDTEKRFLAVPLDAVFRSMETLAKHRAEGAEAHFHAADGYTVTIPWHLLDRHRAALAVRDLDLSEGRDWLPFRQGRNQAVPAPFYLVWPAGTDAVPERYWPYQLVAISIRPFGAAFGAARPRGDDPEIREGFKIFRDICMACHSVNLVGGTVGPELNVPMNPTEYWRLELLPKYIRNAPAFHARSRMPSLVDQLTAENVTAVMSYLTHMREHKICETAEACLAQSE